MRHNGASLSPFWNVSAALRLVTGLSLALVVLSSLGASAQKPSNVGPSPIVIDHDPMGATVGSPPQLVGGGPGWHPPVRVIPDPSLNQIVVERPTPIFVAVGSRGPTRERMRLACYVGRSHSGGTIRLARLREGVDRDYSLKRPTAAISNGRATFVIRFHRSVLRAGHRLLKVRTVYLVSSKVTNGPQGGGAGDIQTVTVLSNDPAAFGLTQRVKP